MCGFERNKQDFFNEAGWIVLHIAEDVDMPDSLKKGPLHAHNFILQMHACLLF